MIGRAAYKVRSWLRVVLPPNWVVLCAAAWCVGIPAFQEAYFASILEGGMPRDFMQLQKVITLLPIAILYAVFRVFLFHPFFNPSYRSWLEDSPWQPQRRLPFGQPYLVPQDALVLALMSLPMILGANIWLDWIWIPYIFLFAYVVCAAIVARLCGEWAAAYAIVFGLTLVGLLPEHPWKSVAVLALLTVIAQIGLIRSLRRFPWDEEDGTLAWLRKKNVPQSVRLNNLSQGRPFDLRSPKPQIASLPRSDAVLGSLLVGWLAYCLAMARPDDPDALDVIRGLGSGFVLVAVLFRLVAYVLNYHWPISLRGRIATGRLILPGYDQVFLAPLAAVLTLTLLPPLLSIVGVPWQISWPVTLSLSLLLLFNIGPRLRRWQLTGWHKHWSATTSTEGQIPQTR